MNLDEIQKKQADFKRELQKGLADLISSDNYDEPRGFQGPGIIYGDEPPKLKESEYLKSATGWVYAAVSAIADAVMKLQLRLYKTSANGEVTEITTHKSLDLLYRVNQFQTFQDFIWLTQQYLELAGEAPWFIDRGEGGKGEPQNIILLQPDRLFIKKSSDNKTENPIAGYTYKIDGIKTISIDYNELIFLKYPDPVNSYRGKGTLQAAATTYDIDAFSEEYNRKFFYNGGRPDSVFTTPNKLTDKQRKTISSDLTKLYKGVKNAQKIAILEDGLEWKPMSLTSKDIEFMEQMKFSRDKLLAIFRVPKSIVAITEDVNLANAKVGEYTFAKWTISPKLIRLVAQLNEFYLPMFKGTENMFFSFDDPVPTDVDTNVKKFDSALSKGYMTINEVRNEINLDDAGPEADVLLVPSSVIPIDLAGSALDFQTQLLSAGKSIKMKSAKNYIRGIIERSGGGYYKALRRIKAIKNAEKAFSKINEKLETIITAQVSKIIHDKKVKKKIADQEWENQKKQFVVETLRLGGRFEPLFIKAMRLLFSEQLKKILKKFPNTRSKKVYIDDYLLDEDEEAQIMVRVVNPIIEKIIVQQGARAARLIGRSKFDLATKPVQEYLRNRAYDFSFETNEETNTLLGEALKEGIANGEGIPQLKARVSTVFNEMEKYRAERIARSEVVRASNFATTEAYKQSDVVSKVQWLTTEDDTTCSLCAPLDGKVMELGDNFFDKGDKVTGSDGSVYDVSYGDVEYPPLHPNCRCTVVPIIK